MGVLTHAAGEQRFQVSRDSLLGREGLGGTGLWCRRERRCCGFVLIRNQERLAQQKLAVVAATYKAAREDHGYLVA